jgi:hypothetical protein
MGMWDGKENVQGEIKSKCRTFSDLETDPISPKRLEEGLCTPGSYRRKMWIGTFFAEVAELCGPSYARTY